MSEDGSVYNMCVYFGYCREKVLNKFGTWYALQYFWFVVSGCVIYAFCFICLSGVTGADGGTNSFHNTGFAVYFAIVCVHTVQLAIETRNWTF